MCMTEGARHAQRGTGVVARTPGPQDPPPHRPDPRRHDAHLRAAVRAHHAPRPRPARPRRPPRRPDRLPRPQPPLLPGDAVRGRHARRGLRAAQHPPRRPGDRLPAGRLRRQGTGVRARVHRARRGTAGQHRRPYVRRGRRRSTRRCSPGPRPSPSTSRSPPTTPASSCTPRGRPAAPRARCSRTATSSGTPSTCSSTTDLIADERALVSAPLFHTAGLNMLTLPVLLKGGTCVLVEAFDPEATFDLIERHRITFMFGVPTMFDQVARHPRWADADLSSLRMLSCGGSPVPTPLIADVPGARAHLPPGLRHDGGGPRHALPRRRARREQGGFGGRAALLQRRAGRTAGPDPGRRRRDRRGRGPRTARHARLLGAARGDGRRPSPTAGSAAGTPPGSTRTATSSSSTASRT